MISGAVVGLIGFVFSSCSVDFDEGGFRGCVFQIVGGRDVEVHPFTAALYRKRPGTVGVGLRGDGDILVKAHGDGDFIRVRVLNITENRNGGAIVDDVVHR